MLREINTKLNAFEIYTIFKNENDLDIYRKEQLRQFYAQIGEIQEVLEMIN